MKFMSRMNEIELMGNVTLQDIKRERWLLSEEAQLYVKYGSAEVLLFEAVPPEGTTKDELKVIG